MEYLLIAGVLLAGYVILKTKGKFTGNQPEPIPAKFTSNQPASIPAESTSHRPEPIPAEFTNHRPASIPAEFLYADFVVIDFETATTNRNSACAVGMVACKENRIISTYRQLLQPPGNKYLETNIKIHGITPSHTRNMPTIAALYQAGLAEILKEDVQLVAHNASFDMSVLRSSLEHHGINTPWIDAVCTVELARKLYPNLPDHKLKTVAKHIGHTLQHHEPLSDATAAAAIMLRWEVAYPQDAKKNREHRNGISPPEYSPVKDPNSPEYILTQALEKIYDILTVLYYVGKSDGQLRTAEREILLAVVRKVAKHDQITDEMINFQLNNMATPSIHVVKLAINRICKSSHHNMVTTYKISQLLVDTQKTAHPAEIEILEYMEKKMVKEGIALELQ